MVVRVAICRREVRFVDIYEDTLHSGPAGGGELSCGVVEEVSV